MTKSSYEEIKNAPFWNLSIEDTYKLLDTDRDGLSEEEALNRASEIGKNRIKQSQRAGKIKIFLDQLRSPLILILIGAFGITLFLKDYKDAIFILFAVLVNTILGFYQENKAEAALSRLQTYIKERTRVLRGDREIEIYAESIVPGDIVRLSSGTRVPADIRLIRTNNLKVEEAVLTGESLAVSKSVSPVSEKTVLGDRASMVFGGTLVVDGIAFGIVVSTGEYTELGKIAVLVGGSEREKTPLQKAIGDFAVKASFLLILFTALVFAWGVYLGFDILEIFLISVAIAVSAVPEGLPIALTVVLAVGVERLAKRKGIVRKLLAAETLGSTTIILTDKTGTLTEAKMELSEVITDHPQEEILSFAIMATDTIVENPEDDYESWRIGGRPMENAIIKGAAKRGVMYPDIKEKYESLETIPFNSRDKFSAVHVRSGSESKWVYLGAPDILVERTIKEDKKREEILRQIEDLAFSGSRVLGIAYKNEFLGLLTFRDPVRKGVKRAIEEVARAGVRTVIVTGDHKGTAVAVAKELGIEVSSKEVLTGKELEKINDEELSKILESIKIFARVSPKDKLRITELYKSKGEIVAVTGDGVNDAPALKGADIGVAVGSGTDVAKGAADLVILDDNFETIVEAISEGRRILDNIKKVIVFLLSNVMDELILIGGALTVGLPLPLNALQILWVNFFADSFPAVALAFEKGDGYLNEKPPRAEESLFDKEVKFLIFVIGALTSLLLMILYFSLMTMGFNEELVKTFIFASFSVYTLFLVFSVKSLSLSILEYNPLSNKYLVMGSGIGILLTLAAIYMPLMQDVLGTVSLPPVWLTGVLLIGIINILAVEAGKALFRKQGN